MSCFFHQDGNLPPRTHHVWVFGSNLSGIHGAGAARIALDVFGRKIGKDTAVGMYSSNLRESYAIPTKDEQIRTMSINEIRPYVDQFIEFVKANPRKHFFVTRIGCGLAGYKDSEIAPLFGELTDVDNVSFAENWKPFLKKN